LADTAHTLDTTTLLDEAAVRAAAERAGGGDASLDTRLEALATFRDTPPPDRVRHLWRYTDFSRLLPESLEPAGPLAMPEIPEPPDGGMVVVLRPGAPPEVRSSDAAREAGVRVLPLGEALEGEELFGTVVPASHGYFEALNAAAWDGGVALTIPGGVHLERAIRLLVVAPDGVSLPRILVVAGRGSEASVVEEHVGGGEATRLVGVTELSVGEGANLRHTVLQRLDAGARAHLTTRARVARDGGISTVVASFGGSLVKMDLGSLLAEQGARSEIVGFVLGEGRQHMDHHTVHEHVAPRTWSNIDFKVALTGRARSAYTGLIRIETTAPGTEAYQENRNLLLSEEARAETIPELEILTDDVQCTHGATVAPLDEEQVFYLESRGIPGDEAERLIVRGFLEATLSRLPDSVRTDVEAAVEQRLKAFEGGHR